MHSLCLCNTVGGDGGDDDDFFIVGIVTTGELFEFVAFCEKYPYVLYNMLAFSCASAIGQVRQCISYVKLYR